LTATDPLSSDHTQRYYRITRLTLPVPVPAFEAVERAGNLIHLSFMAEAGLPYLIEYRDSLTFGSWQTLTNITARPVPATLVVSDSVGNWSQRFYRINVPVPAQP